MERYLDTMDDFGNDVQSIRSIQRILRGEVKGFQYDGEKIDLSGVFRDMGWIGNGFKEGVVLPEHIYNITFSLPDCGPFHNLFNGSRNIEGLVSDISISYKGQLNHDAARQLWESEGYKVRPVRKSLKVTSPADNFLALYGKNVLRVFYQHLDEFLQHFRPINPTDLR